MNLPLQIFLIVLTILLGLITGLLLRRALVQRLKNTILDNWLVQTLGVTVIVLVLILASVPVQYIIAGNFTPIATFWADIQNEKTQLHTIAIPVWNFIQTVLILIFGIGIARTLRRATVRGLGEQHIDINIRTLLGRIFYFIVLTFAIFMALAPWQVSIAVPVTVIGALTVAFTFSIQDILKDLVAGLYILAERPFHIGDQITTANYTGKVEDVQLRATKLRLVSGEELTIPNSLVFGGIVTNNTYYGERRATIVVTLAQEQFDKHETPEKILKIIKDLDIVMAKPEPVVTLSAFAGTISGYTGLVSGYTGKTVALNVRFWLATGQIATVTEVMYALRTALPDADLTIRESAGDI